MDPILLKSTISKFADQEINREVANRDRDQHFDRSLWRGTADIGMLRLFIEPAWGGLGMDLFTGMLLFEHFCNQCEDQGLSFSLAAHLFACVIPIWKYGSDDQKNKYLTPLVNGSMIASHAISESTAGSDTFKMTAYARSHQDGYILNAVKNYCTNASVADIALVYGITDAAKGSVGGVTTFLVHKECFTTGSVQHKLGLRTAHMSDLTVTEQVIPYAQVLGGEGGGNYLFHQSMMWERLGMSIMHLGITSRLFAKSIDFVKTRKINSLPLSQFQSITHVLADMHTEIEATRQLIYHTVRELQSGKNVFQLASMVKLKSSELYKKCANDLLHLQGASGLFVPNDFERAVRDAAASSIYSGTSEIQKNIIAGYLKLT